MYTDFGLAGWLYFVPTKKKEKKKKQKKKKKKKKLSESYNTKQNNPQSSRKEKYEEINPLPGSKFLKGFLLVLTSSVDGGAEVKAGTGDEAREDRGARPGGSDVAVRAEKCLRGAGTGGDP